MNFIEIIVLGCFTLIALPALLLLIDGLILFWSRARVDLRLYYKFMKTTLKPFGWDVYDLSGAFLGWLLFYLIGGLIGGTILCVTYANTGSFGLLIIALILGFIFLPRYFGDILHTLRYCFKSRDSKRIKDLEDRLDSLSK